MRNQDYAAKLSRHRNPTAALISRWLHPQAPAATGGPRPVMVQECALQTETTPPQDLGLGTAIDIRRERDVRLRRDRIALLYQGRRLGELPAEDAQSISRLMDRQLRLSVRVMASKPKGGRGNALKLAVFAA